MNRRFVRRCVLWLLPLLAARAFLPVGFMLAADANGLALGFCPTQSPALAAVFPLGSDAAQHGATHQHHHVPDADAPSASADPPCPYAMGVVAVGGPGASALALVLSFEHEPLALLGRLAPRFGPVRSDSVRGPPLVS